MPVVLEEGRQRFSFHVPSRVTDENLSIARDRSGHEIFQRAECDLAAATVECASLADGRVAVLATHLESVMAAQIRNIIDELENVIGPIVLGETRAATDAAGEVGQGDVRKPADGFRCAIAKRYAI